jgi:hypothetical protein
MDTNTPAPRPRRLLALTLLASTLTLSACLPEACNIVGPSETAGSDQAVDLSVRIVYKDTGPAAISSIKVTSLRGGNGEVRVTGSNSEIVAATNMKVGDTASFSVTAGTFTVNRSCTWNGRVGLLYDATLSVEDNSVDEDRPDPPTVTCVGW